MAFFYNAKNSTSFSITAIGRFFQLAFVLIYTAAFAQQAEIDQQYRQAKSLKEFDRILGEVQKIVEQDSSQSEWQWRMAR